VKHGEFDKPLQMTPSLWNSCCQRFRICSWRLVDGTYQHWSLKREYGPVLMFLCCIFRVLIETDLAIGASPLKRDLQSG